MQKASNNNLEQALDLIANSEVNLSNIFKQDGILKQLTKALVERALQGEIKHHLGYDRDQHNDSPNARNGTTNGRCQGSCRPIFHI